MERFDVRLVGIAELALAIVVLCLFWEGYWWHEYFDTPFSVIALIFGMYLPLCSIFAVGLALNIRRSFISGFALSLLSIVTGILLFSRAFIEFLPRDSLCLYWCAPFIFIALAIIGMATVLLYMLSHMPFDRWKIFLQIGCIALIQIIVIHLLRPFRPTGIHALAGFWGVGIIVSVITFLYIQTSQRIQHAYASLYAALQYVGLLTIGNILGYMTLRTYQIDTHTIEQMLFGPFRHPAGLVTGIAILLTAAVTDGITKISRWYSGIVIASTYVIFTYGLGWFSLSPDHQYSAHSVMISIFSAIIGGAFATLLSSFLHKYEI